MPGPYFILDTHLSQVDGAGKGISHTFLIYRNAFVLIHFNVTAFAMSSSDHLQTLPLQYIMQLS